MTDAEFDRKLGEILETAEEVRQARLDRYERVSESLSRIEEAVKSLDRRVAGLER